MDISTSNYFIYGAPSGAEMFYHSLDLTGKFLFSVNCGSEIMATPGIWPLLPVKFPHEIFENRQQYAKENNLEFHLIFENVYEAPCYIDNLNLLMNTISEKYNIPLEEMIIMSGAQHQHGAKVKNCPVLCIIGYQSMFEINLPIEDPTHHFVSLARNSKEHRVYVTKKIWERGLDKFGHCSLGCIANDFMTKEHISEILGPYANRYPAILDGIIGVVGDMQNSAEDPRISHAFLNVVMETSYERIMLSNWTAPFWTEKTTKPFVWRQVPLILGPLNNLNLLREFKFDLFEDIIDTSYDKEPDPMKRIDMFVDQLEKICQWPLEQCIEYRKKNLHRFNYNRQLAILVWKKLAWEYNMTNLSKVLGMIKTN